MARYKIERCRACGYRHNEPKPGKQNKHCPRCTQLMYYSTNWYISYQTEGVKYIESVSPRAAEAEDVQAKRRVQIRENRFFDIKAAVPWPLAVAKLRNTYSRISAKTQRMYENSISRLEAGGLSRVRLTDHDIADRIDEYICARQDNDAVTNSTINRELATIKRMAKLCKLLDLFNDIKLLPENAPRIRYLSANEREALLMACESPQLRMAILISLDTGLRRDGVYGLAWEHIDFQSKTITRTVKGGRMVQIPMTERLAEELKTYRKQIPLAKHVFPSPNKPGEAVRSDNHRPFFNACRRAGIVDFRFHDLRHTFATNFLFHARDKRALQDILGHTDSRMTDRYAHLLDEQKRASMRRYEAAGE